MTENIPAIMLEALYGDDFEHTLLDKLIRVSRSYLDLASAPDASVAQRTTDIAAAIEILEVAGREVLERQHEPMDKPWEIGTIQGLQASMMFLRTLERPTPASVTFQVSLHDGDPRDPLTEVGQAKPSGYERQEVTFVMKDGALANRDEIQWVDMPACMVTACGIWAGQRFVLPVLLANANRVDKANFVHLPAGQLALSVP